LPDGARRTLATPPARRLWLSPPPYRSVNQSWPWDRRRGRPESHRRGGRPPYTPPKNQKTLQRKRVRDFTPTIETAVGHTGFSLSFLNCRDIEGGARCHPTGKHSGNQSIYADYVKTQKGAHDGAQKTQSALGTLRRNWCRLFYRRHHRHC